MVRLCPPKILLSQVIHILLTILVVTKFLDFVRYLTPNTSGLDHVFPSKDSNMLDFVVLNTERVSHAMKTLESIRNSSHNPSGMYAVPVRKMDNVEIVVIVSKRVGNFATQVIADLLELRHSTGMWFSLSICNASDSYFSELHDIMQYVSNEVNIINIHPFDSHGMDSYKSMLQKELVDYWKCLSIETLAKYVLLIEDDAVPTPYFYEIVSSVAEQLDRRPSIDFVKLFHPMSLRKVPYYFQLSATALVLSCAVCCFVFRSLDHILWILTISVYFTVVIGFFYSCQFFVDLRYAVVSSPYMVASESCCTPAVMFRSSSIQGLVRYLVSFSNSTLAKDDLLDIAPFVSRMTDGNAVVHIGFISSLRGTFVVLDSENELKRKTRTFRDLFSYIISLF
ncbi:hypothetical protein AB6A40_001836 [Gnathostoma spinigerum]|uniref:Uncharacterized protein n=1 Tax=Gnathostoma spinigerum TaxID=75299 RepID=A0ABD6EF29_9BILA